MPLGSSSCDKCPNAGHWVVSVICVSLCGGKLLPGSNIFLVWASSKLKSVLIHIDVLDCMIVIDPITQGSGK